MDLLVVIRLFKIVEVFIENVGFYNKDILITKIKTHTTPNYDICV